MNKRQQQLFISFFQQLHQTQQIIDKLKIDLQLCQGYNPTLLFDLISQGSSQIKIQQMRHFLSQRIGCTHRQLYEIFQKFDWSRNGSINKQDFIKQLTPFGKKPIKLNNNGIINTRIQGSFIAILIEIIKRFRILQVSRKQIVFIQPYNAFQHIDYWKKGIIGLGQLEKFYNKNDFQIGQQQLFYLLHALRRRCYRDVNLEVFCENLNPLEFGQYIKFAQKIQKQNQKQYIERSIHQQKIMKRSRLQAQKFEHQTNRFQRRRQAEIQRQLNLQQKINIDILDHQRNQQLNIRRAILQDQKNIRSRIAYDTQFIRTEQLKNSQQNRRINQLQSIKQQQRSIEQNLAKDALRNQRDIEASRKQNLYKKQRALQQQIARELDSYRTASKIRQLQQSRRDFQLQAIRQRQRALRQMQLSKYRGYPLQSSILAKSNKQSRLVQLQKQLQKTRVQMKDKRNRLDLDDHVRKQYSTSSQSPY